MPLFVTGSRQAAWSVWTQHETTNIMIWISVSHHHRYMDSLSVSRKYHFISHITIHFVDLHSPPQIYLIFGSTQETKVFTEFIFVLLSLYLQKAHQRINRKIYVYKAMYPCIIWTSKIVVAFIYSSISTYLHWDCDCVLHLCRRKVIRLCHLIMEFLYALT